MLAIPRARPFYNTEQKYVKREAYFVKRDTTIRDTKNA